MMPVMNCMYPIFMNIEQEVINNDNQFINQIKKMQQGSHIEMSTTCKETISQKHEFIRKNTALKWTYYLCYKERLFETELKP